jgi:hypothetical protein
VIKNSSDTTATGTLAVAVMLTSSTQQSETYDVTLVKDSQGQWKIDRMDKE